MAKDPKAPVSRAEMIEVGMVVREMAVALDKERQRMQVTARQAAQAELQDVEFELHQLRARIATLNQMNVFLAIMAAVAFGLAAFALWA